MTATTELRLADLDKLEEGEVDDLQTFHVKELGIKLVRDPGLPDPLTHTCRGDVGCGLPLQNIDLAQHVRHHRRLENNGHPAGSDLH